MIVVACTFALFISGYTIQQRTLRDLRAAIKPAPRPSPQVYVQDSADYVAAAASRGKYNDDGGDYNNYNGNSNDGDDGGDDDNTAVEVEVKKSLASLLGGGGGGGGGDGAAAAQRPLSRAERRRKIKEDIKKLSQGESPVYYQRRLW